MATTNLTVGSHFESGEVTSSFRKRKRRKMKIVFWRTFQVVVGITLLGCILSTFLVSSRVPELEELAQNLHSIVVRHPLVSRIAFGSGTASEYGPQPIWQQAVIPTDPHAWIWVGDMAYMDLPTVNCAENKKHPQCRCQVDWLHEKSCMAGNLSHAQARLQSQISNPDYSKFLEFMCPGHREKQVHPPRGPDPSSCPRRIFGTYDDHDYGWQRGNGRLPEKDALKGAYLDAIGEPQSSPRRAPGIGVEHLYTLNSGRKSKEIDIFLLDERYYRDPLPCYLRKDYCFKAVLHNSSHPDFVWCKDLIKGNRAKERGGSCCDKDQKLFFGWCKDKKNKKHQMWKEACDPSFFAFGARAFKVNKKGGIEETESATEADPIESPFCEILGRQQREWLEASLHKSKAPLKLIVSPSPVLANPLPVPCWGPIKNVTRGGNCTCSGEDWECFKPAQLHLLHMLGRAPGCIVILTGDFGYSDIKAVRPGNQLYAEQYRTKELLKGVYQVMASGMVEQKGQEYKCGDWRTADPVNTRENLECDFVSAPSFGLIQVDWDKDDATVKLKIVDGKNGETKLESRFSLNQCNTRHASIWLV